MPGAGVVMDDRALEREIEQQIEELGFELVEAEQRGSKTRPLLRLRIDRPDSTPGNGVSLDDCAAVSRAVERYLDERQDLGERYVLEVSSPGIERPLVKARDFQRFAGEPVVLKTQNPVEKHGKRIEGVLLGLDDADNVRIELADKAVVAIPRNEVVRAKLVFKWEDDK
jgi:ribosome maturation factor RimP